MASLRHLLLVALSSLLLAASSKLLALRSLLQDGAPEAHDLGAQPGSPPGAPGQWEWQAGGDVSRELPQRPRRRRAAVTVSTQAHSHTGPGAGGASAGAPTAVHASERNVTGAPRGVVAAHVNRTESSPARPAGLSPTGTPTGTPTPTADFFDDYTTEGVPSTGAAHSQNASLDGTGRTTVALERTTEVSNVTTGKGPLLDVAQPSTSSPTSVGTSGASTGAPRPKTATPGPIFRATLRDVSVTAKAASSPASTSPAQPPSQSSPPVPPSLVGQCLLAIFLLALVAGLFIVLSTVLAILLWRQRRAYKLNRNSHTEMVCISSLLAHEEAEEAGGRHPRVRRTRMLGENGSEAEMDNLTLNSFLPDH